MKMSQQETIMEIARYANQLLEHEKDEHAMIVVMVGQRTMIMECCGRIVEVKPDSLLRQFQVKLDKDKEN
jgi:hypothetical protein